jgi:hypothetical protein
MRQPDPQEQGLSGQIPAMLRHDFYAYGVSKSSIRKDRRARRVILIGLIAKPEVEVPASAEQIKLMGCALIHH